jgi:Zn-dependent M28 family amino/carboxypeptidase
MKSKTKRAVLAGAVPLALALSACGSGSEAPAPADDAEAPAAPADGAADASAGAAAANTVVATEEAAEADETGAAEAKAASKPKEIPVRGPNGLEGKCLARVGKETGAKVIGTNRIDESQASIDIYVNIEGAEAPWRCRGYRDGTIEGVMYSGSEGAL